MPDIQQQLTEIEKCVNSNQKEIEQLKSGDWYSNKELYEMFVDIKEDLQEFNSNFQKYNGLIEDREAHEQRICDMESDMKEIKDKATAKSDLKETMKDNVVWIIAVVSFAAGLLFDLQAVIGG